MDPDYASPAPPREMSAPELMAHIQTLQAGIALAQRMISNFKEDGYCPSLTCPNNHPGGDPAICLYHLEQELAHAIYLADAALFAYTRLTTRKPFPPNLTEETTK